MEQYWDDFDLEEIHFRDKWQFEIKSHYMPSAKQSRHIYSQELYLFIPATLQVSPETYTKEQFYQDQTNLIRYKTPEFSLQEIINPEERKSPLNQIKRLLADPSIKGSDLNGAEGRIEKELKLLGNMVRTTLRNEASSLLNILHKLRPDEDSTAFVQPVTTLLIHLDIFLKEYQNLQRLFREKGAQNLEKVHLYVADFISVYINNYLAPVLEAMRRNFPDQFPEIDEKLCKVLINEKAWREKWLEEPKNLDSSTSENETILYQIGLLNKYVIDALLLNVSVDPIDKRYRNIIGSLAAALAMSIYILLFVWQGSVFVINSSPFIIFTVFIYVLKDRLKDEIKNLSMKQAFRWFSDYKTEIRTPDNKTVIGELRESFSYLAPSTIPEDVIIERNIEQHKTLEAIRRNEQVMYYKKSVTLKNMSKANQDPFSGLNVIFRLDIHRFLNKASNSIQPYSTIDPETLKLTHTLLPKVYHLNIVLKNSYVRADNSIKMEIKKYRIIANKEGILRVENLSEVEDSTS
jgi:hypothetical protein